MTITLQSIIVAVPDQISTELSGETVILHMGNGVYYGLDPVGTTIWNLIQKPCRVDAVRDAVLEEYDVEPERCQQDLLALLGSLAEQTLIEVRDDASSSD
jgi:hypothetical protein